MLTFFFFWGEGEIINLVRTSERICESVDVGMGVYVGVYNICVCDFTHVRYSMVQEVVNN